MYGADGVFAPRLLAPQMRVILLTSQKDFSVAQAAFDLRVDALLVWSELDAEIFSSRVDRVVSELDEMIHRRGIVKRQLFRDILKGKIPTEEESEKYFELPVKHPQYVMIRINRDRMATQTIRPAASTGTRRTGCWETRIRRSWAIMQSTGTAAIFPQIWSILQP